MPFGRRSPRFRFVCVLTCYESTQSSDGFGLARANRHRMGNFEKFSDLLIDFEPSADHNLNCESHAERKFENLPNWEIMA